MGISTAGLHESLPWMLMDPTTGQARGVDRLPSPAMVSLTKAQGKLPSGRSSQVKHSYGISTFCAS